MGSSIRGSVVPNGLSFTYLKGDGSPASTEGDVKRVLIRLRVEVRGRTQNLTTTVDLRNRGL